MFPSGGAQTRPELLFAGRYAVDGALPWGGLITYYRGATERTPLILSVLPMDVSAAPNAASAFGQLAQRLGRVKSPAIPSVLDAGMLGGVPYFAFEDTRGRLLSDLLRDRPLSSIEVLRLATQLLDALDAAHSCGLVHGDLTPHNVLVSRDARGRLHAHLLGVGLLPLLRAHPDASALAAQTGSGKFAISYMAPELFGGRPEPSSDLYAVGALLQHMVLGSAPVGWESEQGFEDLPGLVDVVRRARSPQPCDRYESAAAMRAALDWIEVESSKRNPQTQDIAPWMETSFVGSIPVPVLASSLPPTHKSSMQAPGTLLSGAPAPRRSGPVRVKRKRVRRDRRWLYLALLLGLLATLVLLGSRYEALSGDARSTYDGRSMVWVDVD